MRFNPTCRFICAALIGSLAFGVSVAVHAQTLNVKPAPIVPPIMPALDTHKDMGTDGANPEPAAVQIAPTPATPPPLSVPPTALVTPTAVLPPAAMPNVPTRNIAGKSIESLIADAIEDHDRVMASRSDLETSRRKARVTLGAWFPKLDSTVDYGWEHQKKHESATTSMPFEEYDLKFSQLLWDFGKTNAAIRKSAVEVTKAETALRRVSNDILLEAIKAYANLIRANNVVGFATRSRVDSGAGLSTDVLQAKTQLAGAEARLVQAEGGFITARNRFANVFEFVPDDVSTLTPLRVPTESLTTTLEDALALAFDNNYRLRAARLDEDIAKEEIKRVRSDEFAPRIEGIIERKWQYDVAGTYGDKGISIGKIELKMPFNLGLTGLDSIAAAKSDYQSKTRAALDLQRIVTEEVRNAWSNLRTAQRNAQTLDNQASIAQAFLELARQEQQLGQRSLIDVLSGETSLINAQSDAASAMVDALIASFDLLNATGTLGTDVLQSSEGEQPPPKSGTVP